MNPINHHRHNNSISFDQKVARNFADGLVAITINNESYDDYAVQAADALISAESALGPVERRERIYSYTIAHLCDALREATETVEVDGGAA